MNNFQQNLFNNLMSLVNETDTFYFKDFALDNSVYRIFSYRLASYTEFLRPGALECRGHTFEMNGEEPIRLAALPFEKFFNLNENPMTMDLDLSTVVEIGVKADGSLISTYTHDLNRGGVGLGDFRELRLKTKGSLTSEQAIDAQNWLDDPQRKDFKDQLFTLDKAGFTVNLEWVSPSNRIVLSYDSASLIVLGIRDRNTGEYLYYDDLNADLYPEILDHWISFEEISNPSDFAASIPDMQGVEGYVVRLESGQRIKVKTSWYLALHHTKDSINSPRRLFEAVLEEATDDMRSLFYHDPLAIKLIEDMENYVDEKYNHMVSTVENFYETNKHMDRKSYAILGQLELDPMFFGLAMMKYVGKEFSYKDFLKRQWKALGLKDVEKTDE